VLHKLLIEDKGVVVIDRPLLKVAREARKLRKIRVYPVSKRRRACFFD